MTHETPPRCPVGVIWFDNQVVIYERFNHGWSAHPLGSNTPMGISTELRAAIEADAQGKPCS